MNRVEIQDKDLLNKINGLEKDEMAVFVMADGRVRGALFHGSRFINQMRVQHNCGILETMVLGQGCLCGALMLPLMKGRERLSWKYEVNGPAEGFSVDVDSTGAVRAYLFNEHIPVEKPLESWDLSPFLGEGTVSISTMMEHDKEPHISTVDVHNKNIALDLATYFDKSEQIHTAFNTGIQMDKMGRVIGAGGLFLQVMPGTGGNKEKGANVTSSSDWDDDEKLLNRVELAFKTAPSLGQWFAEKGTIDDLVYGLFREFNPKIAVRRNVNYDCPCSKEFYLDYLRRLPESQLEDLKKTAADPLEIVCHNCGSVYQIPFSQI